MTVCRYLIYLLVGLYHLNYRSHSEYDTSYVLDLDAFLQYIEYGNAQFNDILARLLIL